jgi:DNA excision repair protein ERCC-4
LYDYGTSETDQAQPIITDYGTKLAVVVYDVSIVTLGSPLKELAYEELTGSFMDGGSIGNGDKVVIGTFISINTWVMVDDISRSQLQYCGLNTTAYTDLAKSTAESQIASFAKQMVTELELVNDCSSIVQVSSMLDGSIDKVHDLEKSDFLLGYFVQLYTLDVSSADGDIPLTVSGSFSPSYGYNLYLTDDFIALPSNIYSYNSTTGSSSYSTFILGFDLSSDGDFKPSSFGHIPGQMYSNYRMDKKDGYLRILPYSTFTDDTWTTTYLSKIYVLELPSTSGAMSLVGDSKLFGEDGSYFVASSRFSGDLAFISGDDYDYENQLPFVVVDLSDPTSPKTVGSLQVRTYTAEQTCLMHVPNP